MLGPNGPRPVYAYTAHFPQRCPECNANGLHPHRGTYPCGTSWQTVVRRPALPNGLALTGACHPSPADPVPHRHTEAI